MPSIAVLTEAASARDVLTQAEARERATRVRQADYDLALDIHAGQSTYRGDATIRFSTTGNGPVFLDFRGRDIELLEVNGTPVSPD